MSSSDILIQPRKPLQLRVYNASQMILPPVASTLNSATVEVWAAGETYAFGDIVRSGRHYYWCVTHGGGVAGATAPIHTDGDATDGTLTWRYVHWSRNVVTLTNVAGAGSISIARGNAAVALNGLVLYDKGSHNEGYDGGPGAYEGAWYGISDDAGGRLLAISEG